MTEQAPVADKVDPAQKRREQQNDRARQQEVQILQKKLQALRSAPKGSDPSIMASYEAEGENIDEVTYPSDFKKGSAVATPRKGRPVQHDQKTDKYGRRKTVDEETEKKGCDCGKTPCECDEREMPTKMDLFKNKLRAKGIKVAGITPAPRNMKTYDDLGEEASDRARDEHQMRGGMAARKDYDRPPAKKLSNKELGIRDFTPAEKAKRAKEMAAHLKKMK